MPGMEDEDQGPGHVVGADHSIVDADACARIVKAARAVAASSGEVAAPGSAEPLQAALRDASPDERSTAVKELADEPEAYQAVHDALAALGVESQ